MRGFTVLVLSWWKVLVIKYIQSTPAWLWGGKIFRKKHNEGVMFNVISVTRGWVGVQFPEK